MFIKNGTWRECHRVAGGKFIKITENLDNYGNKIFCQTYISSGDTSKGFVLLFEESLDSLKMTATFKRFYDNGKIKYIQYGRPLNFYDRVSYYYKGMAVDSIKAFNITGEEVDPKKINTYDVFYYPPAKCKE